MLLSNPMLNQQLNWACQKQTYYALIVWIGWSEYDNFIDFVEQDDGLTMMYIKWINK